MLISQQKQVLIVPARADVQKCVPHAKEFALNGDQYLAVPHKLEETLVLNNLGIPAPNPINYYYNWPGRFAAHKHQRQTAAFMLTYRRAICLNAPGTGKTLSVLWAADYLLSCGLISKVLIIAPLSTLKLVWGKELIHHLPKRKFNIIVGDKSRRRQLIGAKRTQFCIINHDGFSTMPDEFKDFDLVIYDEATALKNPATSRYRIFSRFVRTYNPRTWLLTGTPLTQHPPDVWSLATILNSPEVPRSFTQFKELTMQKAGQFRWIPRTNALDICQQVLRPAIRFTLEDCTDLPALTYVDRECELTQGQKEAYVEMKAEAMLVGKNVTAANAAVVYSKLLQICCGVVYGASGENVVFDDRNRVETFIELLEEIGDKTVVFVPFKHVQQHLINILTKENYDVALVNGDTSKTRRDEIFDTFQHSDKIQVLLAHPRVASHGLDLTRASNSIWYAPYPSVEAYEQANARIRRLSTVSKKMMVHHIVSSGFERSVYRRLQERRSLLTDFLQMMQGTNE